jgi:glycosyltransferase involved in cell wall biosynthesis
LQSDLVLTHSPVEARSLSRVVGSRAFVVPFAVGERRAPPPFAARRGVAFLGGVAHEPNVDAAYWLTRDILPRVWARAPQLTCRIVGHGWRPDTLGPLDPRLEIVGPVENLDDLFAGVRLTVAPLRFGAGIKGKALESFAAATPCVLSEVAAEGLPLCAALAGLVARDADEFAARMLRLHEDEAANVEAGAAAKAVAGLFGQERVTAALRAALAPGATAGGAARVSGEPHERFQRRG